MSKTPFMQLWVGDFLGDTLHLSQAEVGQYLLLMMAMWRNGGSLPGDTKKLKRIARGAVSEAVMAFFDDDSQGGITQFRLQKELQRTQKIQDSYRARANKGNEAKALKNNKAPHAQRTPSEHNSESESESERLKEKGASPPAARKEYSYDGEVVRLNHKDHARWKASFSSLDLDAELIARDVWLSEQPPDIRRRWFASTSKYLANRNMEAKAKAQGPPRPESIGEAAERVGRRMMELEGYGASIIDINSGRELIEYRASKEICEDSS
jgi:uncharacterized protein YdaU (DUF1376 family)